MKHKNKQRRKCVTSLFVVPLQLCVPHVLTFSISAPRQRICLFPQPKKKQAEYFQAHRPRNVVFALETETKYLNGYYLPSLLASCCAV